MKMRLVGLVSVVILAGGLAAAQDLAQGLALYNEGRYAEAEPVFRAMAGGNPEAGAWLAATLERLGRHAEAEAQAKAVLETAPTNPVAVKALGEALVTQEKLDEAVARMSAALAAKNDLAYAYYWRGQAYQRQKHVALMVDDYQAFLTLEPEAPEAPALKVLLGSLR